MLDLHIVRFAKQHFAVDVIVLEAAGVVFTCRGSAAEVAATAEWKSSSFIPLRSLKNCLCRASFLICC